MTHDRLPDADRADVQERKVVSYLLSESHPDGRGKARFFLGHGFTGAEWTVLADALKRHALEHPVRQREETAFGARFVVEGILRTPDGRTPVVRVVWFVGREGGAPRLVTAFPVRRRLP